MTICNKWICRIFVVLFVLSLSQTLYASSAIQSAFESIYADSDSTEKADCQGCHAQNVNQLNSYGKALCDQLSDESGSTDRLLSFESRALAVENLDSDGDGFSNLDEISGSSQPGWTLGDLNPIYRKVFNNNTCVATGTVEAAPSWIEADDLDPLPTSNQAPVTINDTSSTSVDTSVTIDVLANDNDANGDPIEVSAVNSGTSAHGFVSNNISDITYTPESGFCGTAIFQYQATDGIASSNEATVTISVGDTVAPLVTAPSSTLTISLLAGNTEYPASSSDIVNWLATASASDSEDGNLTVTINAPDSFEAGTTTVVFSAIDSCGNTSTATADVIIIIESNNDPIVTAPAPLVLTAPLCATSIPSAELSISNWLALATAYDIEDGNLSVINSAPTNFLIGNTTVAFSATDSLGAIDSMNSNVSVNAAPNSAPVLDTPSPISITVSASTTSVSSTDITIQDFLSFVSAIDNEDGTLVVTNDAPAEFGLGTTAVTFTATDDCGLSSVSQSTVTIIADLTNYPPTITALPPIELETALCSVSLPVTDPLLSAFFNGTTAFDDEDGDLSSSITNNALANLPVTTSPGVLSVITFSVTDSGDPSGTPMTSTTTSRVRLTDPNTGPTLTAPPAITTATPNASVPASDPIITSFLAAAIAEDQQDGALSFSNNAPAVFEPGTTIVTFSTTDSCGLVVTKTSTVTIPIDLIAPVITLLGGNPIDVEQNTAFNDPGAIASDDVDGDITVNIIASGSVNIAVVGTYTLGYNVSDAGGNAATTVTRTVTVSAPVDTTAPVIILLGSNPINVEQNTAFTDPGATANDDVDGDITANIIVSGAVNTAVPGTYALSYQVSDAANNSRTVIRNVIVMADTTAPVITLLGSNPISVEQNTDFIDPGATASDNIDGDITANIVASGTVNTAVVDTYTLLYQVSDAAGNTKLVTRTVSVTAPADITAPIITLLGSNPISVVQNTTFSDPGATASDNVDGNLSANIITSGSVNTALVGTYILSYQVSDVAGNTTAVTRTVSVTPPADITAPVITLLGSDPMNVEQNTTFTDLGATASDDTDGNVTANIIVSGTVVIETVGDYTLSYSVSDAAGNVATVTRTVNVTSPIDNTAPVITLLGNNPINMEQNTTFIDPGATASDNVDGNISANVTVSGSINVGIVGTYVIWYDVTDAAGNVATTATRTVNVHPTTAPVITLSGNSPLEVVLGSNYSEPGYSATDNVDGNITANVSVNSSAINTGVVGSYQVTYDVSDTAGNAAITVIRTVTVTAGADTTAPVIVLLGNNPLEITLGNAYSEPGYSAIDNVDGDITASVSVDSSAVNTSTIGSYSVIYTVSDAAGNAATSVTRTVNVVSATTTYIGNPGLSVGAASVSTTLIITDDIQIADLNVFIDMPHAYPGDVSIILTSPAGTSVTIVDDPGKPASTWGCSNDDFLVTLDDEGAGNVEDTCTSSPAISGTLIPNNALSAFDGESTQGTWTLQLNDSYTQADTGTLNSWSLIITAEPSAGEDITAPVILLLGNNPLALIVGSTYSDPGFSATDNVDGDMTANVLVDSSAVNTSVAGSYAVTYDVTDAAGNATTTITRTVNVTAGTDTIAPVITLLGDSPLDVPLGSNYSDPGFSATDNVDGDISGNVSVNSSAVDTSAAGSYLVTYSVTDAAGNPSTVTRWVNVTTGPDITAPLIALLGNNPLEIVLGGTFNEPGYSAMDNVDGNITASVLVNSSAINTSVTGSYSVTYSVTDAAGNAAITVIRTVNVMAVDTTEPVINLLGNNPLEITEGGVYSEPGYSATDNVDGNITGNVFVDSSSLNTNLVGSYTVIYDVFDTAGNNAVTVIRTVNVIAGADTTAPVISLSGNNPQVILMGGTFFEPGYSATDNIDGNITGSVSVNASAVNTSVIGNYLVTYNVSDAAGNAAATVTRMVNVVSATSTYTENPVLSVGAASISTTLNITDDIQISDLNVFVDMPHAYPGDVSIILTSPAGTSVTIVDDPGKPASTWGCSNDDFLVTLDDEGTGNVEDACTSAPAISGTLIPNNALSAFDGESTQGTWTLQLNDSYTQSDTGTLNSWSLIITAEPAVAPDTIAPLITLLGNNPLALFVGGTYSEPGYSATDNIDGNITAGVLVDSSAVNINLAGNYAVTYNVSDAAGNAATTVVRTVNVTVATDTTAPVITLSGNDPLDIIVGGTYSEPGYSATDNIDGNITGNVSVNSSEVNTSVIGSYSVTYNVSDAAGNPATTVARTVNIVSATTTYSASPSLNVGAASVSTTLNITADIQIADLNVFIDMPHAYPGDVSIILTSPSGTSVTLVDGPGKPASTWGCANDDFLVTLDDEGAGNVENACSSAPAISGSLIPNNALSAFDGESAQGTWTLQLDDSYTQGDTGTLNSWRLEVTAEVTITPETTGDTLAPVLTLLGSSVIEHQNGDTFNDPGATASDNVDGDITANIIVSGTVDINTDGTYVLTYNVQDAAGNNAASISRTINVSSPSSIFTEAETGTVGGSHTIESTHAGYTGAGFVNYAGEGFMDYTFEGSAVPYDLTVRYALGGGDRPLEVILNGASLGTISFPATGAWTTWLSTAPFTITPLSGINTLRLQTTGSSGANVDSFTLTPQ